MIYTISHVVACVCVVFLIGAAIGTLGTLLFFRFDKAWKQVLLSVIGTLSAGGTGSMLLFYFNIKREDAPFFLLAMLIGFGLSVYFSFVKLCKLLKEQTGNNNVIRVLDIVLGYNGFLKDYYESRKKDVDNRLHLEEVERKRIELERKEELLQEKEAKVNEQTAELLKLSLPENEEVVLTNRFIGKLPYIVDHICNFKNNVTKLTDSFIPKFSDDKLHNEECLKAYLVGLGMYVANDLFGVVNNDVRTHFRILKGGVYSRYIVVLGNKISEDKITDIPAGNNMIERSFALKTSLVASLNPSCNYDTKTKWEDFMTIAFPDIIKDGLPFLSMGISIRYKEQFQEVLYFLNFCKIEEFMQSCINRINKACNIVETLK